MKKEWITCNVCGADSFSPINEVDGWTIGRCDECGLIYVNPIAVFEPSPEFSEKSKEFQYTQYQGSNLSDEVVAFEKQQLGENLKTLDKLSGKAHPKVKFLDIGCGSGGSVRAATDMGWDAVGIDLDPELIQKGRDVFKANVRCTTLLDANFEANQFDFIRLRDVIEHLPNPLEALQEINRLLAPGGGLLVSTPNEGALTTRVRELLGQRRSTVATVAPPHHLHGFANETLKRIMERAGLTVYQVGTTTPVDPAYVTSRNMLSSKRPMHVAIWSLGKAMNMGSMLLGWAGKGAS